MNIAVFSPHSGKSGTTTVASLVALELSTRGKTVCLTHTSSKSIALSEYFGLKDLGDDKTANPSKLVNMLRVGAVKPEEIPEYCKAISLNIDAFTTTDGSIRPEDMDYILEYMTTSFPHEFKVFDVDTNYFTEEITKKILQKCDVMLIVTTPGLLELYDLKKELSKLTTLLKYKPAIMVVNKFNRRICDIKSVQGVLGATVSKKAPWFELRYNPQITRFENFGKTLDLYNSMRNGDIPVIDVYKDVGRIASQIMKCGQRGKQIKAKKEMEQEEKIQQAIKGTKAESGTASVSLEKEEAPEEKKA